MATAIALQSKDAATPWHVRSPHHARAACHSCASRAPSIRDQQQRDADVQHALLLRRGEEPHSDAESGRKFSTGNGQAAARTPSRTDSVRMEERWSPLTSGMSLKSAMTTEKRDMNALAKSSGNVSAASLRSEQAAQPRQNLAERLCKPEARRTAAGPTASCGSKSQTARPGRERRRCMPPLGRVNASTASAAGPRSRRSRARHCAHDSAAHQASSQSCKRLAASQAAAHHACKATPRHQCPQERRRVGGVAWGGASTVRRGTAISA
jgi:hypothetical protein